MATYNTLKYGSKGNDVKKLQESLISAGYDLGEGGADGIYGQKTMAAVKDYQSKNGLSADGIAGNQTLGKLYTPTATTQTTTPATTTQAAAPKTPTTAAEWVQHYESKIPGEYQSNWQDQINALYDKIQNQGDFSYDFLADPMYQHYADRYQQNAQRAMRDTMGQAAALTGGYGSSYGQMVGQQTYDQQLEGMNDFIPELRNMAYEQYQNERTADIDALQLLLGREEEDYNRWRDTMSDYNNERDYWYNKYLDEAALAAASKGGSGGGGGSGGKGKDKDKDPLDDSDVDPISIGFDDLDFQLDQETRVGITNQRVDSLIAAALKAGTITDKEAALLRERYRNRNLSGLMGTPYLTTSGVATNPGLGKINAKVDKPNKQTK